VLKRFFRAIPIARTAKEFFEYHFTKNPSPIQTLVEYCKTYGITSIIDVGANVGQFGVDLRRHGYSGEIYSFEPTDEAFRRLQKTCGKDSKWVAINLGLGSKEQSSYINVSGNSGLSSSVLEMTDLHKSNFPSSEYTSREAINLSTLDVQIAILGLDPKLVCLKMDVQGFEAEVIQGAKNGLSRIPLIFFEASITKLYHGELGLLALLNILASYDHKVVELFRGTKSRNGQLLQVDVLTKLEKD
jgi:FkbM family methyltransferase